jgi:hypothetical protein
MFRRIKACGPQLDRTIGFKTSPENQKGTKYEDHDQNTAPGLIAGLLEKELERKGILGLCGIPLAYKRRLIAKTERETHSRGG